MKAQYLILLVAALGVSLHVGRQVVDAAAIDVAKSMATKVADKADQIEPVEQTGGLRQTVMHVALDTGVDKAIDVAGKFIPQIQAASPTLKKLAKPVARWGHEKINSFRKRKDQDGEADQKNVEESKEEDEPQSKRRKVEKESEEKGEDKSAHLKKAEKKSEVKNEKEIDDKPEKDESTQMDTKESEEEGEKKEGLISKITNKMKSITGADKESKGGEEETEREEKNKKEEE